MAKLAEGIIPYDPVMDKSYVNAIGSNGVEAGINTDLLGLSDDILNRLEFVECSIAFTYPRRKNNG